jgi:hypothetical protein
MHYCLVLSTYRLLGLSPASCIFSPQLPHFLGFSLFPSFRHISFSSSSHNSTDSSENGRAFYHHGLCIGRRYGRFKRATTAEKGQVHSSCVVSHPCCRFTSHAPANDISNECKRRKLKCSGGATCSRCARDCAPCVYNIIPKPAASTPSIESPPEDR